MRQHDLQSRFPEAPHDADNGFRIAAAVEEIGTGFRVSGTVAEQGAGNGEHGVPPRRR
jgi:hypothetical protein